MDIPGIKILRSRDFTEKIIKSIHKSVKEINKPLKFMHVCGTHEHTLSKHGLRPLLPKEIEILSGPGCPVCVCPAADIDKAIEIGKRDDTIITTFGDMIRVPATNLSLAQAKAKGADVRIVYGPHDAIKIANAALELLISQSQLRIDGFISPGHVSTIIGLQPFKIFSDAYRVPNIIAGFEPNDVLLGILMLLQQIKNKKFETLNEYSRVVKPEGNKKFQVLGEELDEYLTEDWLYETNTKNLTPRRNLI